MPFGSVLNFLNRGKIIKDQVKRNNSVIFGGKAIKKHIGFFARPTFDYDILSKHPRKSARQLDRSLDSNTGKDNFYTKPALHPGTIKVMHVGLDMKKGTIDDIGIADFSKEKEGFKTKRIDGIRYAALSEIRKDKRASLRSKEFAFRHKKDREDLDRIKASERGLF